MQLIGSHERSYRSTGPGVHRSCQTLAMEHITSEMDLFQSRGTYFVPALSPVGLDDRRKSLFVTCGRISVWAIIRSGRLMRLSPFWVMYLLFMVEATRTRGGRPVHTAEEAEEVMRQANAALVDLPLLSAVDTRLANELKPWPSSHLEPIPSAEEAPALHEYLIDLNVTVRRRMLPRASRSFSGSRQVPSLQERNAEYHRGVTLALFSHVLLGRNLATFPPPPEWKEFLTGFSTPLAYNTRVDDELTLPDILARPGELANESGSVDMTKVRPCNLGRRIELKCLSTSRPADGHTGSKGSTCRHCAYASYCVARVWSHTNVHIAAISGRAAGPARPHTRAAIALPVPLRTPKGAAGWDGP